MKKHIIEQILCSGKMFYRKMTLFPFLTLLLLPTYLIRFEIFNIRTNVLDILFIISIIVLIFQITNNQSLYSVIRASFSLHKFFISFLLFLLVGVFMSILSDFTISTHELGIIKSYFILPIIFAFLFSFVYPTKSKQFLILSYFVTSTLFASILSLGFALFGDGITYDDRLRGFWESPNQLAMYIAPAILLLWISFRNKTPIFSRNIDILSLSLLSATLFFTQSFGGIFTTLLAVLILELFLSKKTFSSKNAYLCLLFILLLITITSFSHEKIKSWASFDERSSIASRIIIWQSAWDIGADYWFFGIGSGNFQKYYLDYQQFYPPYLEWAVPHPHNIFLMFWLSSGILGLMGFFGFLGIVLWKLRIIISKNTKINTETPSQHRTLPVFLFLYFVFFILLWGIIDTPYWRNDLAVLFWLFIFLSMITCRRRNV